jgi:hypothetical protein
MGAKASVVWGSFTPPSTSTSPTLNGSTHKMIVL